MTRGISAGDLTALQNQSMILEDHLKITQRTGQSANGSAYNWITGTVYRYTSGAYDAVISGDGTYVPQSFIRSINYTDETYELSPSGVSITIETLTQSFIDTLTTDSQNSTAIELWRAFRNPTTLAIDARFKVFDGYVTGIDIVGSVSSQAVIIRANSNFAQLDKPHGRTVSDLNLGYNDRITLQWGSYQIQ